MCALKILLDLGICKEAKAFGAFRAILLPLPQQLLSAPPDYFKLLSTDVVTSAGISRELAGTQGGGCASCRAVTAELVLSWDASFPGYSSPLPAAAPVFPMWGGELAAHCTGLGE